VKGPKKFLKQFLEKSVFLGVYVAAEGEFENGGREPRGPWERAQKIFEKYFFERRKGIRKWWA